MPWDVLRAALDVLLGGGAAEPELGFLGGEPLLEPSLMRRAAAYLERRAPPGVRPRLAVTTNGTLIDRRVLGFLATRRVRTFLSFDGVASAQDGRGVGTFDALDGLLRLLRRDWPGYLEDDVTIAITLSSGTLARLADSVRYLLDLGVSSFVAWPLLTHDPGWSELCVEPLDLQLAEVYAACREHYRRTGRVPFAHFRGGGGHRSHRRRGLPMCRIGDGHALFVGVDGEAVACGLLCPTLVDLRAPLLAAAAAAARLGPIDHPDLPQRLAAARDTLAAQRLFGHKEGKRSRLGACGECRDLGECSVCPLSIALATGNDDPDLVPGFQCAFNRLLAKYRRRFSRLRSVA